MNDTETTTYTECENCGAEVDENLTTDMLIAPQTEEEPAEVITICEDCASYDIEPDFYGREEPYGWGE